MGLLAARCPTSQPPAGIWASLIHHWLRRRTPRDRKAPRGRAREKKKRHSKSRRGVVGDGGRFAITHHPSPIITHAIPACPWDSHAACQGGMMGIRAGLVI